MSGPLTPTWVQPSHPDIQEVIITNDSATSFSTKSISRVTLPPFGLFAKLDFPPCTRADEPTYATVQMGKNEHLNLNSDLLYINHSCEPSLVSFLQPSSTTKTQGDSMSATFSYTRAPTHTNIPPFCMRGESD